MPLYSKSEIELELAKAYQARAQGLEGKARVCARRAAGWAAQVYLARSTAIFPTTAFAALQALSTSLSDNSDFHLLLDHLTMRVDESYHLPPGIDLLAEAALLIQSLQERIIN